MSVDALKTTEQADDYRGYPVNDHGKLRYQFFDMPAVAVASDIDSTIDLCKLPPGRVRVLPHLSRISHSAWGAARTLIVGHTAYASRDPGAADAEAANDDAFTPAALDMATASDSVPLSAVLKYDIYSKAGVLVQAKVAGGTIPIGGTLSGCIAYIYE